jgi:oxygen-dependent protoporphyrinogen oxidase
MRIAIVGGGIAGMSAAWELEKARAAGQQVEYVLFERSDRLGGCVRSEIVEGCIVEGGPDSFLSEKPAGRTLCREVGLGESLVGSNDTERKTYIVVKNRMVELPDGLMFMVPTKLIPTALTKLFSLKTKLRMAFELLHPPRPSDRDETVADLVRRHYGNEVVDRLSDPLLSGIYGGSSEQLSVRSVLPRMAEMEAKYGSLTRGMLAGRRKMKKAATGGAAEQRQLPLFTTLRDGMASLVWALEARISPERIRTGVAIEGIERHGEKWVLRTPQGPEHFDGLIVATPANVASMLLRPADGELSAELAGVPYASSVTATLAFNIEDLNSLPEGFGFLVPASEGRAMAACTFVHRKFPGRAPKGIGLLRCFLGGTRAAEMVGASEGELLACFRRDLEEIAGVTAEPLFTRVYRWRSTSAQYAVGHAERIARVRARMARLPGLALAGNAYEGVGVPDCIRGGQHAAKDLLERVGVGELVRE